MRRQAKDFAPGELFYTSEEIGDDKNNMELREVFYVRDPDRQCRHPHNVAVGRIAIVQGDPDISPRYARISTGPCRDPGEMDGRTPAWSVRELPPAWRRFLPRSIS